MTLKKDIELGAAVANAGFKQLEASRLAPMTAPAGKRRSHAAAKSW